jgi:hypothetical protein
VTDTSLAEGGIRQTLAEGKVTNYELTVRPKSGPETVVSELSAPEAPVEIASDRRVLSQ